jgi:tripeptide aminopeptidase
MDCVQPCEGVEPVVADGVVSSAGDTVLGGDDKGGIAVALEGVRRIVESDLGFGPIDVIFTVSEETGLTGAKALDPGSVDGDLCLVFDAEGEPGGIVVGAPTHYTFKAIFRGQAAHAGVAPEQGRSAIVMAADAVGSMRHGRLDEITTANIGTVEGGVATNVVAAEAKLTGECRSLDRERVEAVREEMDSSMKAAAERAEGSVDLEWTVEYEGFRFDGEDPMLDLVEAAMADVGLTPRRFETGGGSDGNILYANGVPTLVLSSGLRDVHSVDESVRVADLENLAQLVCAVAGRLAE